MLQHLISPTNQKGKIYVGHIPTTGIDLGQGVALESAHGRAGQVGIFFVGGICRPGWVFFFVAGYKKSLHVIEVTFISEQ